MDQFIQFPSVDIWGWLCSRFCQCLASAPWIFLGALSNFQMLVVPLCLGTLCTCTPAAGRCAALAVTGCMCPWKRLGKRLHQLVI